MAHVLAHDLAHVLAHDVAHEWVHLLHAFLYLCATLATSLWVNPRDSALALQRRQQRQPWLQKRFRDQDAQDAQNAQDAQDEKDALVRSCLNAGVVAGVILLAGPYVVQANDPPVCFMLPCTVACVVMFFCLYGVAADVHRSMCPCAQVSGSTVKNSGSGARWKRTHGRLPWRYSALDHPVIFCVTTFALPYLSAVYLCQGGGFLGAVAILPLVLAQMQQHDANVEQFTFALR